MEVRITNVRIAFATLFEPRSVNGEGDPRFSATFIIEQASPLAKALDKAITQVATEKWKDKAPGVLKKLFSEGRVCLLKGAKTNQSGEVYEGFEDTWSINSSNKARPTVVDRNRSPLTQADGKPYSGCYVNAVVELWAQDNNWGRRVNATLKGVQFVRDGDAFTGTRVASADAFEDLGVDEDAAAIV